jgi:hypothetical protein
MPSATTLSDEMTAVTASQKVSPLNLIVEKIGM